MPLPFEIFDTILSLMETGPSGGYRFTIGLD